MAELKTKATKKNVSAFLDTIADENARRDCRTLVRMMQKATKAEPKMWGSAIVGFGDHHYKYDSGREGDWFKTGFSPRKNALTLYGLGIQSQPALMSKLGKFKTGKGCLYVKKLSDVDLGVLEKLIEKSAKL